MPDIVIKEVVTRKELRKFIYLPEKVHENNPEWLPPIYMDEWVLFDRKKNKSFLYADAVLWLAYRDKKPVGRIMGIISKRYNEIHNEKHGRYCFLECYEDKEVVHALITIVEEWARKNGMVRLIGPLAFSDKDPQGFQIEGFEYPSFIVSATNSPYLPLLIEQEGYEKKVDLVNHFMKIPEKLPIVYEKALARITRNEDFKLIEFSSKREIKPYIIPVLELLNETFTEIYGFVPLTDKEKQEFADRYMMIVDPKFVVVVEAGGDLVGFTVGVRDISPGVKAARGRMFPFGFIKILRESKRSKKLLLMLGGVKKSYRGRGVDAMMAIKILESCIRNKMDAAEGHLVLETNTAMRAECERVGGQIRRKFRIYQKAL